MSQKYTYGSKWLMLFKVCKLAACFLLLPLGIPFATGVSAKPHDEVNSAHARGDYETELKILKFEANSGQAWAQNNLGNSYRDGAGLTESYQDAVFWYRKAADQNDRGGLLNLGQMYENGLGVEESHWEAGRLYRAAGLAGANEGWQLLLRLCNSRTYPDPRDCAAIPAGTKPTPKWNFPKIAKHQLIKIGLTIFGVFSPFIFIYYRAKQIENENESRAGEYVFVVLFFLLFVAISIILAVVWNSLD